MNKLRISATMRIAIGMSFLSASVLLASLLLKIVPDRFGAVVEGRKALSETIAMSCSLLARQDETDRMRAMLTAIVKRNPDIISAAIRRESGRYVAEVNDHRANWNADSAVADFNVYAVVPIMASNQEQWGTTELRFRSLEPQGRLGVLQNPTVRLIVFFVSASLPVYFVYLQKTLVHLDPNKAVPGRVRNALDNLTEGLVVLDTKERIVLANGAFSEMVGKEAEKLVGRRLEDFCWSHAPKEDGIHEYPWKEALRDGTPRKSFMLQLVDAESCERTFMTNCAPVPGYEGKCRGVLVSFEDVTPLEEKKVELTKAKAEAEQANFAKTAFLANMSHEIRTPMNAILGFTDVLRRNFEHNELKRREHLNTIHSSGQHLLALINDILDLSKVESGRLELELLRCSPHQVVAEVLAVLRVKANEKNLELAYQPDEQLPETVLTDPARLRQTLINLVGNAIKFTDQGGVTVKSRLASEGDRPQLVFDVVDTGIGMSPDVIDKIFEPFAQADESVTRRYGGTGLGLAISHRFAEALGGSLTATSELGKGSVFTLLIDIGSLDGVPMIGAEEARNIKVQDLEIETMPGALPPSRILVVDDGEENRELLTLVLKEVGVDVETADNGKRAVDLAIAQPFDVILLDMQMPIMDGYTAARVLRDQGYKRPIIALTANAMTGDEDKCLDAGCSGFLPKPIDMDRLFQTLAEVLGHEQPTQRPVPPVGQPSETETDGGSVTGDNSAIDDSPLVSTLPTHKPQFATIVKKFVVRLDEQLAAMEATLESHDLEALAQLAHWLKGSGGSVGFDVFTEPARELEQLAKGDDRDGAAAMVAQLRGLAARIVVEEGATAEVSS